MTETAEDAPFEEPADPAEEQEDEEPDDGDVQGGDVPEHAEDIAPPPPQGMSERDLEKVRVKLERSATTWRNRVSELLGAEAQFLVSCELCDPIIPGFHFPAEVEQPRDDTHARLLDVLRTPDGPEFRQGTTTRTCPECDGWGEVLSGSRKAGKERIVCPACKGYGFVPPPGAPQNGSTAPEPVLAAVGGGGDDFAPTDSDPWGSPRLLPDGQENPNYGRMPQYKDRDLP